jgi:hypothetical protein
MKQLLLTIFSAMTLFSNGQSLPCGYKTTCECDSVINHKPIDNSDFIFEGVVISIDTLLLSNIITSKSLRKLYSDTLVYSSCAKNIIDRTKVLTATMQISKFHQGKHRGRTIQICTPTDYQLCGYHNFIIGKQYTVYTTTEKTADIYYTYSLDHEYFFLKPKYKNWTNHCMQTKKIGATGLEKY